MSRTLNTVLMTICCLALCPATISSADRRAIVWEATGMLLECCTCNVPCTCNFGQGSSPHSFCHTIYAYRLKTARYDNVVLDNLTFGGGEGAQGAFGFLDARATPAQRPALQRLALAVFGKGGASPGARRFAFVRITAEDDARAFHLDFEGSGGFKADILLGGDGKTPIIVENNLTWPVHRFIKGKTTTFTYKDPLGNDLRYTGTNANIGEFHLSGTAAATSDRLLHPSQTACGSARR